MNANVAVLVGRELDKLVAERIMGWTECNWIPAGVVGEILVGFPPDGKHRVRKTIGGAAYWVINGAAEVPRYSANIEDAMAVLCHARRGNGFTIVGEAAGNRYLCSIHNCGSGAGASISEAICRAALLAAGVPT